MGIEELEWWRQISKWWALIVLGAIALLAGLAIQSDRAMIIGAVLAIVGGCGDRFDHLDINIGRGQVVLKKETIKQAVLRTAIDQGVSPPDAQGYADAITADFPEGGAPVTIIGSGNAEALLSDSSSIVFRVPAGKKLNEEELAEELAESHTEYLKRGAGTHPSESGEHGNRLGDPRQVHTVVNEPDGPPPNPPDSGLLESLEGKLDPERHSLIFSTGEFSLRKYEVEPGCRVTIGRGGDNDLPLIGPLVSRTHALLDCPVDGPAAISNLASTHGIYVNGERVEGQVLAGGDVIGIGNYTLLYEAPRPASSIA